MKTPCHESDPRYGTTPCTAGSAAQQDATMNPLTSSRLATAVPKLLHSIPRKPPTKNECSASSKQQHQQALHTAVAYLIGAAGLHTVQPWGHKLAYSTMVQTGIQFAPFSVSMHASAKLCMYCADTCLQTSITTCKTTARSEGTMEPSGPGQFSTRCLPALLFFFFFCFCCGSAIHYIYETHM